MCENVDEEAILRVPVTFYPALSLLAGALARV
jgi:hypothetical protein